MKKLSAIVLVFCFIFLMFGCGAGTETETKNPNNSEAAEKGSDVPATIDDTSDVPVSADDTEKKEKAEKIDEKISAIGDITIVSGDAIQKARKEYDNADPDVKNYVTKLDVLTAAETSFDALLNEHGESSLTSFYTDYDQVEKITWYMPNAIPEYIDERCYVLPYIGLQNGKAWVVIRWNYTGDDWIFYKKAVIATDSKKYTKAFRYFDINHDNDGGVVWETLDQTDVSVADLEVLYDMATSANTIVRFEGDNYSYDLTLSSGDKAVILDALYAYNYLNK